MHAELRTREVCDVMLAGDPPADERERACRERLLAAAHDWANLIPGAGLELSWRD